MGLYDQACDITISSFKCLDLMLTALATLGEFLDLREQEPDIVDAMQTQQAANLAALPRLPPSPEEQSAKIGTRLEIQLQPSTERKIFSASAMYE